MNPIPLRSNNISSASWSTAREQELQKLKQELNEQAKLVNYSSDVKKSSDLTNISQQAQQKNILDAQNLEEEKTLDVDAFKQGGKDTKEDLSAAEAVSKLAEIESKLAKLEAEREAVIAKLKSRDAEVRQHEEAHVRVGQELAGAPSYETQTGPDGKSYVINGEVPIDAAKEKDPDATMRKMQKVMRAALAPAEPSAADHQVYSIAQANYNEARVLKKQLDDEIAKENLEKAKILAEKRIEANEEYGAKTHILNKMAFEEAISSLMGEKEPVTFPFAKKRNQVVAVLQKLELFGNKNPTPQETVQNFFNWASGLKLPGVYSAGANLDIAA